jgi:hypothetical protein
MFKFVCIKSLSNGVKEQFTEPVEIFANHVSGKELISKVNNRKNPNDSIQK